jgi:hypothetical protein
MSESKEEWDDADPKFASSDFDNKAFVVEIQFRRFVFLLRLFYRLSCLTVP